MSAQQPPSEDWGTVTPASREWAAPAVTEVILGAAPAPGEPPAEVPLAWLRPVLARVRALRNELRRGWFGLTTEAGGPLTDWLLACLIARENALLLGTPGTAKSEIVTRLFTLLGLNRPTVDANLARTGLAGAESPIAWWARREAHERATHKYFHYLLSRFTQPEELFGPIEIDLLRRGHLVRVNFGMLTGPGVRAAFLDEVFKAGANILNTLLTLTQERLYPNWGGMVRSDLVAFVGASNEMPGGLSGGQTAAGWDEFEGLYAFLDRFPIRLYVPPASGTSVGTERSALAQAFDLALGREGARFATGDAFADAPRQVSSINDLLLLGRGLFQHLRPGAIQPAPFQNAANADLAAFRQTFLRIATDLQGSQTFLADNRIRWTISPRKLRALYKIALAHAAVISDDTDGVIPLRGRSLRVFDFIWDSGLVRDELAAAVGTRVTTS